MEPVGPAPSLELKPPSFRGHSPAPQTPASMKTKRLALLDERKDGLLIQTLTLLYYSAPAFPLLLGGAQSNRTGEEGGEESKERMRALWTLPKARWKKKNSSIDLLLLALS